MSDWRKHGETVRRLRESYRPLNGGVSDDDVREMDAVLVAIDRIAMSADTGAPASQGSNLSSAARAAHAAIPTCGVCVFFRSLGGSRGKCTEAPPAADQMLPVVGGGHYCGRGLFFFEDGELLSFADWHARMARESTRPIENSDIYDVTPHETPFAAMAAARQGDSGPDTEGDA